MTKPVFYECGICGHFHSAEWDGDCRQDDARFTADQLDELHGPFEWEEGDMPGAWDHPRAPTVCVWPRNSGLWFWDDAEDHGGFDRISPMGPFHSREDAVADVRAIWTCAEIADGYPDHYPSAEAH